MNLIDARPVVKFRLMVRVPGLSFRVEWRPQSHLDACPL